MPLFAPRARPVGWSPGGLLREGFDFGFGWSGIFDEFIDDALPVGARAIVEAWRGRTARRAPTSLPPVVISEIPSVILPGTTPRGAISKTGDVPETWEELEELIPEIFEPILETRPGRRPDPYPGSDAAAAVIDPTPASPGSVDDDDFTEAEDMAHSWLHLGSDILAAYTSPTAGVAAAPMGFAGPARVPGAGAVPGFTYGTDNGIPCKRRRRRRALLTEGDFNSLMRIATLPNNANVRTALAKAVGRR